MKNLRTKVERAAEAVCAGIRRVFLSPAIGPNVGSGMGRASRELAKRRTSPFPQRAPLRLVVCPVTAAFSCLLAFSISGAPDIEALALIVNPPRVTRLVAKRTFADGTEAFILMKCDRGNVFVKMSKSRSSLDKRLLVKGDTVSGRAGKQVWVGSEGVGTDLWAADIDVPPTTNPTVLQHQRTTLLLADHSSRLGRSLLTFGIDVPLSATVLITNRSVNYEDGGFNVTANVEVKSPTRGNTIPFCARWRKVPIAERGAVSGRSDGASDELYECNGELSSQTNLPLWFELLQIDATGQKRRLGRAEILEAEFASKALPTDSFSVLANVDGGVHALLLQTNDALLQQDLFFGARSERKVYLVGHLFSTKAIRYFVLLSIVAVSLVFAAVVVFTNRRRATNQ